MIKNNNEFNKNNFDDNFNNIKHINLQTICLKNIIIIIIIFLSLLNEIKNNKMENKYFFLKEIKNQKDKKLFFKDKILFYLSLRTRYLKSHNIIYNETNLITFQQKVNWLLIHENPEYKSNIVDKIKLHDYSIKILGKDICVPILKIYENENDINLNELPNQFVLKLNHGSAMNIICTDKLKLNLKETIKKLKIWKNKNYGLWSTEFQYMYVKRKIYAEQFLSDDLIDYKVFCFNGKSKFIRIRKKLKYKNKIIKIHNHYDINWKLNNLESGLRGYIRKPDIKIKKPKNLDLMIKYANKLSEEFVFVRVDFYDFNNTIYLGELTFTPSNSFIKWKNLEQNIYIGSFMDLSKIKKSFYNK